jgi:hypothetical protein
MISNEKSLTSYELLAPLGTVRRRLLALFGYG